MTKQTVISTWPSTYEALLPQGRASFPEDPVEFFRESLGCDTVWPKMIDMLEAVRDEPRVSVSGCNSSSKDYTAGRIVLWWLKSRHPAKVIVIGPTQRQVQHILWGEARTAYHNAPVPLGGRMLPENPLWKFDDEHFAMGFSTDRPYQITGFHSPNLLVIITEAHEVAQSHIDAVQMLNPKKILMTGNPLIASGEFYDSHHGLGDYKTVQISAYDTPNIQEGREIIPGMVTLEDIEQKRRSWGEGNPLYIASVLGQFPANLGGGIVPLDWVQRAVEAELVPTRPIVLAVDVAERGADWTVVYLRAGPRARIVYRTGYTDNVMDTVAWIDRYMEDNPTVEHCVVDSVGIGSGVAGRLKELGRRVIDFRGGENAYDKDKFANRSAEAWWQMREAFEHGIIDIENDAALKGQLVGRGYKHQSDKRIQLQPKSELSKSPDEADALAMTFALGHTPLGEQAEGISKWTSSGQATPEEADVDKDRGEPSRWAH